MRRGNYTLISGEETGYYFIFSAIGVFLNSRNCERYLLHYFPTKEPTHISVQSLKKNTR